MLASEKPYADLSSGLHAHQRVRLSLPPTPYYGTTEPRQWGSGPKGIALHAIATDA
jgi:hypothetical protein